MADTDSTPRTADEFVRWLAEGGKEGLGADEVSRLAQRVLSRPVNLLLPMDAKYVQDVEKDVEKRGETWDPEGLTVVYTDRGISPGMQEEMNDIAAQGRAVVLRTLARYPADWIQPWSVWRHLRRPERLIEVMWVKQDSGYVTLRNLDRTWMREVSMVNFWRLYRLEYRIQTPGRDLPKRDRR